jgi:predicted dehydrogenase
MSQYLRVGVIGVGFVGAAHVEAVRRTGLADVVGVVAGSVASGQASAKRLAVPRAYPSWRELLADPEIDVVHNCTPNLLHAPVALAALESGKHLVCEKPLALTAEEGQAIVDAAGTSTCETALCHNYRHYAMIGRARELIRDGAIGEVHHVHGAYLQDWLCDPDAINWRLSPDTGGHSLTFADIGTHLADLAAHLTGHRIEEVCAALGHHRKLVGEDHVGMLGRFDDGSLATFVTSQVSPGSKNGLRVQIDGSLGALSWNQERPESLDLGRYSGPSEHHSKAIADFGTEARSLVHLPVGHPEGWNSTFANLFRSFYRRILGITIPGDDHVATLADGLHLMRLVEAVQISGRERRWVRIVDGSPG